MSKSGLGWIVLCGTLLFFGANPTWAGSIYSFNAGGNGKGKRISKGWGRVRVMDVHRNWVYLFSS